MSKFGGALELSREAKGPSAGEQSKVLTWTRTGFVQGTWGAYDSFESLVFAQPLQSQLQKLALGFLSAQDICSKARVPWRRGAFLWGPAGTGKTAASRAIALLLGWQHVTIPASEILDAHALTRALHEVAAHPLSVVVLDHIDVILKRVDVSDFLTVFDEISERAEGFYWIATTRTPENVPKSQLVRPGRFDDSLRVTQPTADVKTRFYEAYIAPFLKSVGVDVENVKADHLAALDSNPSLSYAHLQEIRVLMTKVLMDGDPAALSEAIQTYCQEQLIGGNRWGGQTAATEELAERARLVDPRHLLSALQVTDAFKRIIELSVSSASEALTAASELQKK